MSRLKRAAATAAVLFIAGCSGDSAAPLTGPSDGPSKVISDAAHAGAVPGFYFLPPMVPSPSYSGTFDAGLSPRVEICELAGTSCGAAIATFTSGTGSTNVRVSAADQNYIVNWHTGQYNLNTSKTYRISVYQGSFLLGFADVDVVGTAKELKNVDTQQFIPLLDDRTLPIKFRVETGIVGQVVVSPVVDSVNVGQTAQFTATLIDLHGNTVSGPAPAWSSSSPAIATVDNTGLAAGVAPGTATITASLGYVSGSATLVVEQPNQPPVAGDDTFEAIGNVSVPVAAPGLLAGDTDPDGDALSAVAGTFPTANGGTVTIAADGSFTYLSGAGFTGTDSFEYTVTDGIATAGGTVTMDVPTRVWYVSNAAAGDGRDASPFATLKEAEAASAPGETIFVLSGNGTTIGYDEGIVLKAGQALTGQGVPANVTATLNGQTVVLLAAGSAPTVARADAGAAIQLATGNTVQGLNVTSAAGAGIAGSGFGTFTAGSVSVGANGGPSLDLENGTVAASFGALSSAGSAGAGLRLADVGGTLTAPGGSVLNAAGAGVEVSGGDADVTYGGSISGSGTRAVSVTGRNGGTLTLSGDITDTVGGILVQDNTGGTIAFTGGAKALSTGAASGVTLANNGGATTIFAGGGLSIATTTATGFTATGGGTVQVTGADNAIGTTSGTAIRIANTTIGAGGVTFRSVSASNGANGIVLENTGALGGFKVTGTGSAGSGGTIQNMTGADGTTAGIGVYLSGATAVELGWMQLSGFDNFAIRGVNVAGLTLNGVAVSGTSGDNAALDEAGVLFEELTGSAAVTGSSFAGGVEDNFRVVNTGGVLNRITFDGVTIGANATSTGNDGVSLVARNAAVLNATVQNSFFTSARGDLLQLNLQNTASADLVATGNAFSNNHPNIVAGGGGVTLNSPSGASPTLTYQITGNSFRDAAGSALAVLKSGGTGSFSGTIANNVIGVAGAANSGSTQGSGIDLSAMGGGSHTVAVTGNQIRQYNNFGVLLTTGANSLGGQGALNATVTGNTIAEPGTLGTLPMNGIQLNGGINSGDAHQVCLALSGNTLAGSGAVGGTDFRLRQRFLTTVRLPGYAGANNDNAAVTAFVQANNAGAPTGNVANTVSTGGGGYVGGAACAQP